MRARPCIPRHPISYETITPICVRGKNVKGDYIHRIGTRLEDITSISLESAIIPNTQYLINVYNDRFTFRSTALLLHHGNYTPHEMAIALETLMQSVDATVTVIFSNQFQKFTIQAATDFTLSTSALGNVLGFNESCVSTGGKLVSQNMVDFSGLQLIKVKIKDVGIVGHIPVTGPLVQYHSSPDRFAINRSVYRSAAPLKSLTELTISLLDSDDQKIDFHGGMHTLVFSVTCREGRPFAVVGRGRR